MIFSVTSMARVHSQIDQKRNRKNYFWVNILDYEDKN
jgi:hypothetical protein